MKNLNIQKLDLQKRFIIKEDLLLNLWDYGLGALTLNSVPLINANASNLNKPTSYKDITTYNNYYEFGTG